MTSELIVLSFFGSLKRSIGKNSVSAMMESGRSIRLVTVRTPTTNRSPVLIGENWDFTVQYVKDASNRVPK